MSVTASTSPNPFDLALQRAQQRETDAALVQKQQDLERETAREKAAEAARIKAFQDGIRQWVMRFFVAVADTADKRGWKPEAVKQARAYAEALVCSKTDNPLPVTDPGIAKVVQDRFAYGIALDAKRSIPADFFTGQRQDWFPELFKTKAAQVERARSNTQHVR